MKAANRRLSVIALAAALMLVPAAAALAAATSGSYAGGTTQTSQRPGSVHFKVTANHAAVQDFSGDIWATCTKSGTPTTAQITLDPTTDMSIHKGAFGFHGNFDIDNGTKNGTVVIAKHVDGKIKGKFVSGHEATGTMSFTWTFDNRAPSAFRKAHCTTGTVKFTAKHA